MFNGVGILCSPEHNPIDFQNGPAGSFLFVDRVVIGTNFMFVEYCSHSIPKGGYEWLRQRQVQPQGQAGGIEPTLAGVGKAQGRLSGWVGEHECVEPAVNGAGVVVAGHRSAGVVLHREAGAVQGDARQVRDGEMTVG
jgi:hypothetical protein